MSYRWIEDPGHAWLVVPLEDVKESGYEPTSFSFIEGGLAYLEEDVDAGGFLRAAGITDWNFPMTYVEDFDRGKPRFPDRTTVA